MIVNSTVNPFSNLLCSSNTQEERAESKISSLIQQIFNGVLEEAKLCLDVDFSKKEFCEIKVIEKDQDAKSQAIWLEMKMFDDELMLIASDSKSEDLKESNYRFTEITFQKEMIGELAAFTAPSFGGPKGISFVKKLMESIGIKSLIFGDGSLVLTKHCCENGAVSSLRMLEIFKNGMTWYQKQGAKTLSSIEGLESLIVKELLHEDETTTEEMIAKTLGRINLECKIESESFEQACGFLSKITAQELTESLEVYKSDSRLEKVYQAIQRALSITNQPVDTTLGNIIKKLVSIDKEENNSNVHQTMHQFIDLVINHNEDVYMAYVELELQNHPNESAIASFALPVLHYLENIFSLSQLDLTSEIFEKLLLQEDISKELSEQYGSELKEKDFLKIALQNLFDGLKDSKEDCVEQKVFYHSSEKSILQYIEQTEVGLVGQNPFDIIRKVLFLFGNIKLSIIDLVCPRFTEYLSEGLQEVSLKEHQDKTFKGFFIYLKENYKDSEEVMLPFLEVFTYSFLAERISQRIDDKEFLLDNYFNAKLYCYSYNPFVLVK